MLDHLHVHLQVTVQAARAPLCGVRRVYFAAQLASPGSSKRTLT